MTESTSFQPLVSVIIPCYNRERYISEAINSILDQSYPFIEIIVVDDGSTDKSVEVIKSYQDKIILIEQKNKGPSSARNTGIQNSHGELLVFLDSDDYISRDLISDHIRAFNRWPDAGVFCANWSTFHEEMIPEVTTSDWPVEPEIPLDKIITEHLPFPACLMYKRKYVDLAGGFDEEMRNTEDCDFLIRAVLQGAKMVRSGGNGYATYRTTPNSITKNDGVIRFYKNQIRLVKKLLSMDCSSDSYFLSLVMNRLMKNRTDYWFGCLRWHLSLLPIEIVKFLYYLFRVSLIDFGYFGYLIKLKPWTISSQVD